MPFPFMIPTSASRKPQKGPIQRLHDFLAATTQTRGFAGNSVQAGDFSSQLLGAPWERPRRDPGGAAAAVNTLLWDLRIPNHRSGTVAILSF